jgi:hypothetical protein
MLFRQAAGNSYIAEIRTASQVLDDEWMESVRSGKAFSGRSQQHGGSSAPLPIPRRLGVSPYTPSGEPFSMTGSGRRTMCVRLCDGYAWPISYSTGGGSFARDQQTCERSCSSPTRLYVQLNPRGDMEQMTDFSGRPYSALPTAFMFRASYDEGCKCRPHPWEPESLERHRQYALEAKSRKGDKKATAELKELGAKGLAAGTWAGTGAQGGQRAKSERTGGQKR